MSNEAIIGAVAGIAGAVLGGIIGAVGAWIVAVKTDKSQKALAEENARAQRLAFVEAMIQKLSEFAIQYPTLEKDSYCSAYPKCPGDENGRERYENYCTYLFNTINAVFRYCDGDPEKVKGLLAVEELIKRHYRCWSNDDGNLGYDEPFKLFINKIIDDLRKRKEITWPI